jgi:aminodeoxyfutalosine deaminase
MHLGNATPTGPCSITPKIELHVHLEGTVRPRTLLEIARRNNVTLPIESESDLLKLYQYKDFGHFLDLWMLTTGVIRTEGDFRQIVLDYAREASSYGAVYLEGIFTPVERTVGGASWDEVFSGFCDGAQEAREQFGIEIRLTPDIPRDRGTEIAMKTSRFSIKYADRGIVGIGIGGPEDGFPPEPFERAFLYAKEGGLGSVPHAGEVCGPDSIRGALDTLKADRLRHGIRAIEDRGLLQEIVDREVVLDVCPISNVRTRAVDSLSQHPLPALLAAGALCSINTDDPAMFGTDLQAEYEVAIGLGCDAQQAFRAGLKGALCDEVTRERLRRIADKFAWTTQTVA